MTASERLQKFALRQSAVIGNIACQHIQITLKEERKGSFVPKIKSEIWDIFYLHTLPRIAARVFIPSVITFSRSGEILSTSQFKMIATGPEKNHLPGDTCRPLEDSLDVDLLSAHLVSWAKLSWGRLVITQSVHKSISWGCDLPTLF